MLWLASLLGIATVGAATMVDVERDLKDDVDDIPEDAVMKDVLILGEDVLVSEEAKEPTSMDDWFSAGAGEHIEGFDPGGQSLLVVYDDTTQDAPEVYVQPDPQDETLTNILLAGATVAVVRGGPVTLANVSLMPLSAARAAGFAPA